MSIMYPSKLTFFNGALYRICDEMQGWKLLTFRLSGTGKNCGGQVNYFWHFSEGKASIFPILTSPYVWPSHGKAKIMMDRERERQTFFVVVISTPVKCLTRQLPMGAGHCQWGGLTDQNIM